ncbi:MAG: HypC/HybG/HupF family hydrogenase formation chaperone [Acidimicrobiales bacterium]
MCLGIPGQVAEILDPEQLRAVVDVNGVRREISVALVGIGGVEGVEVGDWVLIHVGFAMAKIDEEDAAATMETLQLLGSVFDDEVRQFGGEPVP